MQPSSPIIIPGEGQRLPFLLREHDAVDDAFRVEEEGDKDTDQEEEKREDDIRRRLLNGGILVHRDYVLCLTKGLCFYGIQVVIIFLMEQTVIKIICRRRVKTPLAGHLSSQFLKSLTLSRLTTASKPGWGRSSTIRRLLK